MPSDKRIGAMLFAVLIAFSGCSSPERHWEKAKKTDSISDYQAFLRKYPDSQFAPAARQRIEELRWPPASLSADKKPNVADKMRITLVPVPGEWGYVYADASQKTVLGTGPRFGVKEYYVLLKPIFSIDKAEPCFAENSYAVVYFDDRETWLKIDRDAGHSMVQWSSGDFGTAWVMGGLKDSVLCAGAKVQYGDKTYQLRSDGWYLGEKLLHRFGDRPQ